MKVKELLEKLSEFDPELDVMTKKTDIGNIGEVFDVRNSSYGFFGMSIPCVLLTDECADE